MNKCIFNIICMWQLIALFIMLTVSEICMSFIYMYVNKSYTDVFKIGGFLMFSYLVFIYTFYGDFFCFCFSNFLCFTKSPWFRNMVSSTSPFLLSLHFFFGKNANFKSSFCSFKILRLEQNLKKKDIDSL